MAAGVLLGALSLDIYVGRNLVLPGGGVLNMAWHWAQAGEPFTLVSRVGDD
jgi:sugar/nucleoside kinase (ribokinase family)